MRALCLAIALAACGAAPPPPPVIATPIAPVVVAPPDAAVDAEPVVAAALRTLGQLTEAMCQCRDAACANRLAEDMRTWGQALARARASDDPRPTEAEEHELVELGDRLTTCMTSAMTSPQTPAPP